MHQLTPIKGSDCYYMVRFQYLLVNKIHKKTQQKNNVLNMLTQNSLYEEIRRQCYTASSSSTKSNKVKICKNLNHINLVHDSFNGRLHLSQDQKNITSYAQSKNSEFQIHKWAENAL